MFALARNFSALRLTSLQDDDGCNPYTIGHVCMDASPYAEDGSDTASMNYQGGYDSGFAAGMTWGTAMVEKTK
eukprot:CAMPEP_0181298618 /NCGR_PEP_ID=MMETSP1101-20121128/5882_1 /TAXON_ID=46948 /ORGANISM="Rhodomonas abbreviata, Strain Caron Lab Isolate" /LENGTH=72 /DNA_ID=CAMNT_0023403659 /DNA_START=35 /DNA_END=253 /DNA_ORIENTATION=-